MKRDEFYMQRCLDLACLGLGKTYPNPMVGAVIVHQDKIIGEGWHKCAGEAHAEVNAVLSVKDKSLLNDSTIYVNLEPCSHYGKTPPCAKLIIDYDIPNVVVGCVDPFSEVSGSGIKMMTDAGLNVKVGVLQNECIASHKRFFTFHQKLRPYIILKWAESKDGFIAPLHQEKRKPYWISSSDSKKLVHQWRTEEQAILVGTNTAEMDNPKLTARLAEGNQPLRIVLDKSLRLSKDLALFDKSVPTLVYTEKNTQYIADGIIYATIDFNHLHQSLLLDLFTRNIQSIIIEGGKQTLQSFIDLELWDEARVFISPNKLVQGIKAPQITGREHSSQFVSNDNLIFILR